MSEPTMLDMLAGYLDVRREDRRAEVERLAGTLTTREIRLVREAAVMGYVQGAKNGPYRKTIPHDSEILREVLEGCLAHADLYPVITGYTEDEP